MNDWTSGYVADIGYTFGYYQELNPLRVKLAFLHAGLAFPDVGAACELGFGQGMSANIHAAASLTSWHGTDFNPAQAGFAQEIATASGAGAMLYDEAFSAFANRTDLPDFDYIGLHGIWSWISDENRKVIVDFIRRKLKVGGVLYISYNTQPGWAAFTPIRQLMTEHSEIMGFEGQGTVNRVDGALDFTDRLLATNPIYATANPLITERFRKLKDQNRSYLAHEYFNRDWHPMHFADMAEWLAPAKLSYAGSAHYHDHIDVVNLTDEQRAFLKEINDVTFKENVRDFMINQQFRRDYWVKGARKLNAVERSDALRSQRVIMAENRADISLKVTSPRGEVNMSEGVYNPVLDMLADYKPKTIGQIEQYVQNIGLNFSHVLEAVMVLVGSSSILPVQEDALVSKVKKQTDKLNAYLISKSRGINDISFLASPVTGGGVVVGRFPQLFLLAQSQGRKQPSEWAQFVWHILAAQNQKIIKEGKVIETEEENIAELAEQAAVFAAKKLPVLKALGVI
ncbi:class I SAM-dependent methyltransferase [Candidatus Methylospira mobilis]|uniref:class I SAM-dependent methyltransferase n=1 Tax=Candidatus Methylospira mobilis TaxID=1808979 RepID=UPI0028E4C81E|nr:class I SAM-dependent methyltransferase [Candidatus Methylospira mobilis]WNV05372.1 class I SAM-dependent methyltransferase [Candidatus Methylospira mobilis]